MHVYVISRFTEALEALNELRRCVGRNADVASAFELRDTAQQCPPVTQRRITRLNYTSQVTHFLGY